MSTCHGLISILAVRQHRHQDLSQHMKASYNQSEELFSRSHITKYFFKRKLYLLSPCICFYILFNHDLIVNPDDSWTR